MKPGEKFESDAVKYLNEKYGFNKKIKFIGGDTSDSTKSDIEVVISGRKSFFIEAKDATAQSGQFVLIPNEQSKKFIFSEKNRSDCNEMTKIIITHMNNNFDKYNLAGTSGMTIDIDKKIFYKWIVNYYRNKGVAFFITRKKFFIVFPIHKFANYFKVSAKYRIKKSGSHKPSKKYIEDTKKR